ncbi:MAG: DUF4351 domain-containing protein [Pseudanabaenaceae cyanobacterium SKYGB_i_bin29]|nr:DUF4351 domain-containing protein [Pseudanabaenaceae cyanobacterium SKYG29]MDW8420613.1 DUF4351 domain-containing protein [Pseudanabaenaceae cyanobacterium SKYGB_i_bin29]
MFTLDDLRQTKVYQESLREGIEQGLQRGRQEGRLEGETQLLLRLISRKFGSIASDRSEQIKSLPIDPIEELTEALLDSTTIDELYQWLDRF